MINRNIANIIVPLTDEATNLAFRYEFEKTSDFVYLAMGRHEIYTIIDSPISEVINKQIEFDLSGCEEEECVDFEKLEIMRKELKELHKEQKGGMVKYYSSIIIELLNIAIEKKTGIFFHL